MKLLLLAGAATLLASGLSGCVVVPAEPVIYGPPAVVVHPGHFHRHHHGHGHGRRGRR